MKTCKDSLTRRKGESACFPLPCFNLCGRERGSVMSFRKDLTGKRFGLLVVLRENGKDSNGSLRWDAECDCGKIKNLSGSSLKRGQTKSCGCLKKGRKPAHGMCFSPEYMVWRTIKERCRNPNIRNYHNYGGRGIKICKKWADSFDSFLQDVGERPSENHYIDRIDNDGDYEPGNIRWVTAIQSTANRGCQSRSQTGIKGVSKIKNKYRALMEYKGKVVLRQRFNTLIEAAAAYNEAAKKYHGEYAHLNDLESLNEQR